MAEQGLNIGNCKLTRHVLKAARIKRLHFGTAPISNTVLAFAKAQRFTVQRECSPVGW
jgi:hypothetical protein